MIWLNMQNQLPYEKYKVSSHDVNIAVVKNKTQRDNVLIVDYNENIEEIIHRYFLGEDDGFISKDLLSKRWNKYYHSSKFNWLNSYKPSKFISLGEVAKISCGPLTSKSVEKGSTIILSKDNLVNGRIVPTVRDKYAEQGTVQSFGEYVLQDDDIVVNIPMDGYCNVARYDKNTEPAMVQFPYYLIRSKDEYFKEFMRTRTGISFFEDYLNRQKKGPTKVIYIEDVEDFKIPILDSEDLKLVEKKYTDSLNEEDILARLISIKLEIEENRKDRENYYNRIKELDKGIELRKKDSVSKDREIELLKRDKESLERSLLEKDEEKKELEERIRLYKEITPEDNELIIKTINELVKELREEIHLSKLELSTEIKKVDKRVAGVEKDMVEVKETMEKYGRLVEEIHSIVNKLYDIQGDILMKLNKTPNEGREELYVELSNRIWELINTNYEIKRAQAYDKIVEEYIDKFTERGWEKLDEYTRTYLVTARVVYEDLKYNDKLDFSPSCIALTKALERELFIHLFNRMIEYFQRDKNRNLNHLPDGIIHKSHRGPKYQKEKYYSLGKIPYILALKFSDRNISDHDKKKKEESLNEFLSSGVFKKDCFKDPSERDGYIKELGSKVSDITNKYRNEAAHKDRVDKIKAIECYDLIIETEQILIEFINKLA